MIRSRKYEIDDEDFSDITELKKAIKEKNIETGGKSFNTIGDLITEEEETKIFKRKNMLFYKRFQ